MNVSKLRDVDVEDLLGRDPIKVDMESIYNYVKGKVILVTGGGGSIGSELCRQIAGHDPKQLIIVDIYENNAYDIQQELKYKYPELDLVVLIASVRNTNRMIILISFTMRLRISMYHLWRIALMKQSRIMYLVPGRQHRQQYNMVLRSLL